MVNRQHAPSQPSSTAAASSQHVTVSLGLNIGAKTSTALSAERDIYKIPSHCSDLDRAHIEYNQNECEDELDIRKSCTRDEITTLSHHLWYTWAAQRAIVRYTLCCGNRIAKCFCGTDIIPHPRGCGCLTRRDVDKNASLSSNIEASEPMTYIYLHAVGSLIINARED